MSLSIVFKVYRKYVKVTLAAKKINLPTLVVTVVLVLDTVILKLTHQSHNASSEIKLNMYVYF